MAANQIMAAVQPYIDQLEAELQKKNKVTEVLEQIEKSTGVKRLNVVLAGLGFFALIFVFMFGGEFIMNVVAFFYPAYKSVRAIESKGGDDDTQWLMYWVVYSYMHFCEFFVDIILWWFPFYYTFKLALCCWCMAPMKQNGSYFIYYNCVKPLLDRYGSHLETAEQQMMSKVQNAGSDIVNQATNMADGHLRQRMMDSLQNQASDMLSTEETTAAAETPKDQ